MKLTFVALKLSLSLWTLYYHIWGFSGINVLVFAACLGFYKLIG